MPIEISSDTLIDIEKPFKVSAGPGAGKTYWIVQHIKNVLKNSDRLFTTKKILCITYTNIATETILARLGSSSNQVEISTIHSFFYNHIVKPYVAFIANEFGLNVKLLDGHEDTILSNYQFLQDWKARTGQQRIRDDHTVISAFENLKWKFEGENLIAKTDYPIKVGAYAIKNSSYLEYKKMSWEKGIMHHDDVLFFTYQIIKKHPFVSKIISSKFPYIYIDEFQDSNPIQVAIIKEFAKQSVIGIIGDIAQSIYGFQGADPLQFKTFYLAGMEVYNLSHNRRSTNDIIDFLNSIRTDIKQEYLRNISISRPTLIVGDMVRALKEVKIKCPSEDIYSLSRDNITSNAMKAEINGSSLDNTLLKMLKEKDKNTQRARLILTCIKAIAFAKESRFKDAIREFEKFFNYRNDKIKGKKKSIAYLTILLEKFEEYKNNALLDFSNFVKNNVDNNISKVSAGEVKIFYETNSFQNLYMCVNIPEDASFNKTIHKSKGDEFDNVLLLLKNQDNLQFIIEPDLITDEEHRIYYVGVSRAKNKLFINVPSLDAAIEARLEAFMMVERI